MDRCNVGIYRHAAQMCVYYHCEMWHEHHKPQEDALKTAKRLYEEHGPFELDWPWPYNGEGQDWYDEQQTGEKQ